LPKGGELPDSGSGGVAVPELVIAPLDGKIYFNVPFEMTAMFTAEAPQKILIQVSGARTYVEYALSEAEKSAGRASFRFTFTTAQKGSAVGALTSALMSGVTPQAGETSNITIKVVLVAGGGTSNAARADLTLTGRPVPSDGGYPDAGADTGADTGDLPDVSDAGVDSGSDTGDLPDVSDGGEDAGADAGATDYAPSAVAGLSIRFDEYTHQVVNTWYFLSSTAILNGSMEFPYTFAKNGANDTTIEFNVGGIDRYFMTWTGATGGSCTEKYESDVTYPCTFQIVQSPSDGGYPDAAVD
jgi:hypothetical protein